MKKTAIYIRVSTNDQTHASQEAEITRWLANHGISDYVVFADKATGDNLERSGFKALEKAIFAGEVSTVVVYKLDRLARSLCDGIVTLTNWLERGVRVVSTSQSFDFSGVTGKLIASVLLAVAEIEQGTRRERQAAGIEVAKAAGVYKGRKKGTLTVDPSEAKTLKSKGLTVTQIAKMLNCSNQTVYRHLAMG